MNRHVQDLSNKQRPLDSSRCPRCAASLIIGASLLSGNIHEDLRGAGVCVIGMVVGKTTCIDPLQGVYSFILCNPLRLSFFCYPHFIYLYKTNFPEISFETKGVPWLLAGRMWFLFSVFGVGLFFAKIPSLIRGPFPSPQRNSLLC